MIGYQQAIVLPIGCNEGAANLVADTDVDLSPQTGSSRYHLIFPSSAQFRSIESGVMASTST